MAKRTYNYEKRQRELAQKKKREKKRQAKQEKGNFLPKDTADQPSNEERPEQGSSP